MNYGEIFQLVKNIIDETDTDEQVDSIVKSSINEAYTELCRVDSRLSTSYIPVINGIATLPDDLISIVKAEPEFENGERVVGNAILSPLEGKTYTIIYNYTREPLVSDTDEVDLDTGLHYALALYATSIYFGHRKRIETSEMFNQRYEAKKFQWKQDKESHSGVNETVIDLYGLFD